MILINFDLKKNMLKEISKICLLVVQLNNAGISKELVQDLKYLKKPIFTVIYIINLEAYLWYAAKDSK